ncbi:MAG: hypothetical protein HDQ88_10820, partial [Clostridia bacterium]|nr:hypothetical protein [Clostridia bacterium]
MGFNTPIPQKQVTTDPDKLTRLRGIDGLITVDTERHVVVVMDGVTYGGHPQVPEYRKIKAGTPNVKINGGSEADLSKDVTIAVLPGTTPTGIRFVENPEGQPKGKYLAISYLDRKWQEATYYVDASLVVDLYTAGTGIKITGNEISLDPDAVLGAGSVEPGGGIVTTPAGKLKVDAAAIVSSDAGNLLSIGSDGKLFLKGLVSADEGNILTDGSDGKAYFPANLG